MTQPSPAENVSEPRLASLKPSDDARAWATGASTLGQCSCGQLIDAHTRLQTFRPYGVDWSEREPVRHPFPDGLADEDFGAVVLVERLQPSREVHGCAEDSVAHSI